MRGPRWLRVGLAIACAPVLVGAVVMVFRADISASVVGGSLVGTSLALAWTRRRARRDQR